MADKRRCKTDGPYYVRASLEIFEPEAETKKEKHLTKQIERIKKRE